MFARPRLGALGLRGRIVGAVLVTAVAALAVAAVALLGPLERSLKDAAKTTLKKELGKAPTARFDGTDPALVTFVGVTEHQLDLKGRAELKLLQNDLEKLQDNTGATELSLLSANSYPPQPLVVWPSRSPIASADSYGDVIAALRVRHPGPHYGFGTIGGADYVQAALPFATRATSKQPGGRWVVAIRKNIGEIPGAVHAVRVAFLEAALVALLLTLIIGIPLSGRIVRRLRRLRQAALELAEGRPAVHVPVDRARDEVGDLARTFALMQHRLERQEEARRAFVATASHELRTPLASLDGMLELLAEDLGSGDPDLLDAETLLDRARAQSRRLGRLAADLLDLTRIDARVELRSEPVELGELSRAVIAEFDLGTAERGISTVLHDQAGSVWALGDPGSVARILRILLDNAIRHSPERGEVAVELLGGPHASLSVRDQGPGVSEEERELIFERFMRGRETLGRSGFGLGLAIGRELAHRMGGELVLERLGEPGATFTLRLPVAGAPEEEPVAVA